ncbi:aminotransferase class I/II-fold pyridoxal phosphate-dependent enzyme [Actinomadura sp. WMMB 499]|uniref:aminotransferase class I/II-fold pyridoxal phosphate-dependent enzyme n=1 Tax=Actinomadura sp. WMMB 499 TaxID=1219491 RepID=UPI0012489454|nr:aminotransferase class I/II-fold pyridoxal phosphate-dependent enzyme [Actinomadura sp. WMMB 499]QFG21436.1 aminotransferase class I/II-fold pyridoxal phosphate-dependent enzyme [Actinomadura sp. WMMB 499]
MKGAIDRAAFAAVGLRPGRRPPTGPPDTAVKILGRTWTAPIAGPDGALLVAETTDRPVQIRRGHPDEPALEAGTVEFAQVGTPAEAVRAVERGAAGLIVAGSAGSAALDALPRVATAVARRCPILLDGGAELGADVLAALALGADAVVLDPAADTARIVAELRAAMAFAGAATISDVDASCVRVEQAAPPAANRSGADLHVAELHPSLADPVLDAMNFLNEITFRHPDAISFAPGRPYDGFFDNEQIFEYVRRYLDHRAGTGATPDDLRTELFQYGPTAGRIRDVIADSLRADEGIDVPPEAIVVTVGAQEAMLLVLRALAAGPRDSVLASTPCYVGFTGAARILGVPVTAVPEGPDGPRPAALEAAILAERAAGRRPRAFYVVPDHSNPSGATVDLPARRALLDLAAHHDMLIIEDTPYRLVSPGRPLPTLKSLDRDRRVVHVGSFSKTLFPGARVGFAVADQTVADGTGRAAPLAAELAKIKSMVTVNTPSLSQAAVAGALLAADGRVSRLNAEAAEYYGRAMRATLDRLDRELPAARRAALGVRWTAPSGGFFLTVQVPFDADDAALARSARDFGVIWTPMTQFHPEGGGLDRLRLSTSYLAPAEIDEGIARLVRFIESESVRSRREAR